MVSLIRYMESIIMRTVQKASAFRHEDLNQFYGNSANGMYAVRLAHYPHAVIYANLMVGRTIAWAKFKCICQPPSV